MIKNSYLKVMSIVIAMFLWVLVVSGQTETTSMSVPIKLINAPKGFVAVSAVQDVSVTVEGPAKIVGGMTYSSIILNIDVADFPVGDSMRRILPGDFKTPIGVGVVEVLPHEAKITIDQIATKQVKVIPTFIGEVKKGFKVESVTTNPSVVEVAGAKSKLRALDSIATLPVNISGGNESMAYNIGFLFDNGVKQITPDHIEVRVKMREEIVQKEFKKVDVLCMDLKKGLTMKSTPQLSNVKISGRSDLVDNFLSSSSFIVNCSEIAKPGNYSALVAYQTTLEGVEILSISPQKINFEIIK